MRKIESINDIKASDLRVIKPKPWNESKNYVNLLLYRTGFKHDSGYARIGIAGVVHSGEGILLEQCGFPDDICWDFSGIVDNETMSSELNGLRCDAIYPNGALRYWGNNLCFEVGTHLSSMTIKIKRR